MINEHSNSNQFLLIGDSHLRYSHTYLNESLPNIIIKSIRGLKWIDYFDDNLSVSSLLSSSEIQSALNSSKGVLFLVGTNSIRIKSAREVINEIKHIILLLKCTYPHLNYPGAITISLAFPCLKITKKFPRTTFLLSNIDIFNRQLRHLSFEIDFEIIDFRIKHHDLTYDKMHLRSSSYRRIFRIIVIYVDKFIRASTLTTHTAIASLVRSQSSSNTTSNQKHFSRSNLNWFLIR